MKPEVYESKGERTNRLAELGLDEADLTEAVSVGLSDALATTEHDVRIARGMYMYMTGTRTLRDVLIPKGWRVQRSKNYETILNASKKIAIVVASGDSFTGGRGEQVPHTRNGKGAVTREVVSRNQYTFTDVVPDFPFVGTETQTWLLLHHIDLDSGELRYELALPSGMSPQGLVTEWRERIILPPLSINAILPDLDSFEDDTDTEEFDFDIEERF